MVRNQDNPGHLRLAAFPISPLSAIPIFGLTASPLWHLDSAADLVKVDQLASHAPFVQLAQIAELAQVNQFYRLRLALIEAACHAPSDQLAQLASQKNLALCLP